MRTDERVTVEAGTLDRRLTIRTYTTTRNNLNQKVKDTPTDIDTWASVMEADLSKEVELTDQKTYKAVIKIVVRYRAQWRNLEGQVIYNGSTYEIRSVREMPGTARRTYMVITGIVYE